MDAYAALLAEGEKLLQQDILAAAEAEEHALVAPTRARVAAARGRLEEVWGEYLFVCMLCV